MSEDYYLTDAAVAEIIKGGKAPVPLAGFRVDHAEGMTSIHCFGAGYLTILAGLMIASQTAPEENLRDVFRTIVRTITHA